MPIKHLTDATLRALAKAPAAHGKIIALQEFERQAFTLVNATQRQISELSKAEDLNPHGDKAVYTATN
jgi:hypothetical protein